MVPALAVSAHPCRHPCPHPSPSVTQRAASGVECLPQGCGEAMHRLGGLHLSPVFTQLIFRGSGTFR